MRRKARHYEARDAQPQGLQTTCSQCVLKKEDLCPYLETIVNCHLFNSKGRGSLNGLKRERRQHPRLITSIPAFISNDGSGKARLHVGSITDISLGGLRISIPRGMRHEVLTCPQTPEFEIITKLPDENKPIHLKCKSQRIVYSKDNIYIGASIVDADFRSFKAFKNYLM